MFVKEAFWNKITEECNNRKITNPNGKLPMNAKKDVKTFLANLDSTDENAVFVCDLTIESMQDKSFVHKVVDDWCMAENVEMWHNMAVGKKSGVNNGGFCVVV